jgi:hypothetical protein
MGAVIEIKFFNSFLLKKTVETTGDDVPAYDGSRGIPQIIGGYPAITESGGTYGSVSSWVIEEARIRGGYNNTNVDYGVKAYLVEEDPNGYRRGNTLIYSGIFNSRTGVNDSNVFSVGEDITKSVDPLKGTIQKLYAEDSNLIIFQENKVNRALIDKDAIYTAEGGGTPVSQLNLVIGQIVPYAGEFGISKDPGSFAVYGYRKYFTDKTQNVVLRLSRDGITEISNYGMRDYFRDEFISIDDNEGSGRIIGGWDIHNSQYVISTRRNVNSNNTSYNTVVFDESVLGWTSFFTYAPDALLSLRNNFYSVKNNKLYKHYSSEVNRGNFYGEDNNTSITFIFNPNVSMVKNFNTVNYEGGSGFEVTSFKSGFTGQDQFNSNYSSVQDSANVVKSYEGGEYAINSSGQVIVRADYNNSPTDPVNPGFGTTNPPVPRYYAGFTRKENKYVANLVNNSPAIPGEVRFGSQISGVKGFFATVTISTDMEINQTTKQAISGTDIGGLKELFAVSSNYTESSY